MSKEFRVAIVGGRKFNDYQMLRKAVDHMLQKKIAEGFKIVILDGGAIGADALGKKYALERGFEVCTHKADWDLHGKSAGYRRNEVMSNDADAVIAFWDQQSRGTAHMIRYTQSRNKPVQVFTY